MNMLRLFREILTQRQLRSWFWFKLTHPFDRPVDAYNSPQQFKDIQLSPSIELHKLSLIPLQLIKENDLDESKIFIRLASQKISLEQFWHFHIHKHNDKLCGEDTEALYRFNGLLLLACENKCSAATLEKTLDGWFHEYSFNSVAMQAYVISERLANVAILIYRSEIFKAWSVERLALFKQSVRKDIEVLLQNLEYLGERLTGNHLSNNARGLAWGACLIGDKQLLNRALDLAWQESQRIFDSDAFLREGSSNYHSLLTRNYLELLFIARQFALPIQDQLSLLCKKLCDNSALLRPQQQEPFIGDISPDFPHEYFSDIPYFLNTSEKSIHERKPASGWASHFVDSVVTRETTQSFVSKSFARLDHEQTSILCHYNPDGYPILASHAHCDNGSFVAYHQNKEIIIDAGRCNYNERDDEMISSRYHNFIQINQCSLENHIRGVYGPLFLKKLFTPPIVQSPEPNKLEFNFYWNKFKIRHKRVIQITKQQIQISDTLEGNGNHLFELNLNFADSNIAQKCHSTLGPIKLESKSRSQNYGQTTTMTVAYVKKQMHLPCTIETIVDLC